MNELLYREAERRLWDSKGATPLEHTLHLERNGVTVRVQEVGEGPAAVFVHGATNGGTSWAALAARLEGFRCIILDRPGCGLSGPQPPFSEYDSLPRFAETLVIDVLDALQLESAHLVVTSFGGYIGLRTAAAHPGRVRRMVQFSWPVGASRARLPVFMRMTAVPGLGRLMGALPPNERSVRMMFRQIGHGESLKSGRIAPVDIAWYLALLRHTGTMRNELAWGRAFMSPLRGFKEQLILSDSLLAKIQTPTLFLWGEEDPSGVRRRRASSSSACPTPNSTSFPAPVTHPGSTTRTTASRPPAGS